MLDSRREDGGSKTRRKGGRAGGARKGGDVMPCDLPAASRLEPHELGLNPAGANY